MPVGAPGKDVALPVTIVYLSININIQELYCSAECRLLVITLLMDGIIVSRHRPAYLSLVTHADQRPTDMATVDTD